MLIRCCFSYYHAFGTVGKQPYRMDGCTSYILISYPINVDAVYIDNTIKSNYLCNCVFIIK